MPKTLEYVGFIGFALNPNAAFASGWRSGSGSTAASFSYAAAVWASALSAWRSMSLALRSKPIASCRLKAMGRNQYSSLTTHRPLDL